MQFLLIFAAVLSGILVGVFFMGLWTLKLKIGTLRAVSDEDGTYLFLDLDVHPRSLKNLHWALVRIDSSSTPQK